MKILHVLVQYPNYITITLWLYGPMKYTQSILS